MLFKILLVKQIVKLCGYVNYGSIVVKPNKGFFQEANDPLEFLFVQVDLVICKR